MLEISTFDIIRMYENSNGIQFQRAREARPRKNTMQFQRCTNFYVLGDDISLQFLRVKNFYFLGVPN